MGTSWQDKAGVARKVRDESLGKVQPCLPPHSSKLPQRTLEIPRALLTPREVSLTEDFTVTELLGKLRTREILSEELTRAFLRRAAIAQQMTNCVTQLMWDEAIERARYLDSLPKPLGLLHGLPISTKEIQGMRGSGMTCNSSYVAWIGEICTQPLLLHEILWNAGCVFYVRTTQPQTVMHLETCSNVYGRTVNPYHQEHTAGGSSGGEGALVAMRGSLLGLGGDIGGSIRVPAAFNGVYGYKPTTSRLPGGNARMHMTGKETILGINGPICTDRQTIELFMKVVLDAKPWLSNPSVYPQFWTPYHFDSPLRIAVQWSDNIVTPHPPIIRALRSVSEACRRSGFEVVDWQSLNHDQGWDITSALYFPDGGEEVMGILAESGEPVLPLTDFIIKDQPTVRHRSQKELWKLCEERDKYRSLYSNHWTATGAAEGKEVDVILGPAYPGCAPPHDCARYWPYTSTWNLLDYPAVVFPVSTVLPEDEPNFEYRPKNIQDEYNYKLYDKDRYLGLPINLQLIARRNHDEKLLAALSLIEKTLGRE